MPKRLVCDLQAVMAVRFILGVAQFSQKTPRLRNFSNIYSIFASIVLICLVYCYSGRIDPYIKYGRSIEYLIYVFISLQTEESYIYNFYKFLPGIDNLTDAKKFFKRLDLYLKFVMFLVVLSKIISIVIVCYRSGILRMVNESIGLFAMDLVGLSTELCRTNLVIIFSLLYCRVKLINNALRTEFYTLPNKLRVVNYVQKYEMLLKSLKQIGYPLQFLIAVYILYLGHTLSAQVFRYVTGLKQNNVDILNITWFLISCLPPAVPLILGCVAMDLVIDNINDMKVIFVEKRILADNERQRSEVDQLLETLEVHPLNYTVYRTVPITACVTLSLISFAIINTMAIFQIKDKFI